MIIMRNSKKAQNAGQILTYVLAILVVGLILFFGYKSIRDITSRTEKVSLIDFQQSLTSKIKKISSQYGASEIYIISVPTAVKEICFVNNRQSVLLNTDGIYPIIKEALTSASPVAKNVFPIGVNNQLAAQPMLIGEIDFPNSDNPSTKSVQCFKIKSGKLTINLEGKGDHVVIS